VISVTDSSGYIRNALMVFNGAHVEFAGSDPTKGIDVFFVSILPAIRWFYHGLSPHANNTFLKNPENSPEK
jgi:hypothetical protein